MEKKEYESLVEKLAEEIIDSAFAEKQADTEEKGMQKVAFEDLTPEMQIAVEKAANVYNDALLMKQAAEETYAEAQAYLDACNRIFDEAGFDYESAR